MSYKTVIFVIVVSYLVSLFVGYLIELEHVQYSVDKINSYMARAAKIALLQATEIDSFFDDRNVGVVAVVDGKFQNVPLFESFYGVGSKEDVFTRMYSTTAFEFYRLRFSHLNMPVLFRDSTGKMQQWYNIPKLLAVGEDIVGRGLRSGITSPRGFRPSVIDELIKSYGYDKAKHENSEGEYYNPPTRLNMTYVDPDLLSVLFAANMDALMRSKYAKSGYSLNTKEGGDGDFEGKYTPLSYNSGLSNPANAQYEKNPVNDGAVTYFRGDLVTGVGIQTPMLFSGRDVSIEYKAIDIYDDSNNSLLALLYGGGITGSGLRARGYSNLNPMTGAPYSRMPVVIAKVTFRADFLIHYSTVLYRLMSRNGVVGGKAKTFEYTQYFVITY